MSNPTPMNESWDDPPIDPAERPDAIDTDEPDRGLDGQLGSPSISNTEYLERRAGKDDDTQPGGREQWDDPLAMNTDKEQPGRMEDWATGQSAELNNFNENA